VIKYDVSVRDSDGSSDCSMADYCEIIYKLAGSNSVTIN
jgi:hypothetical protein